MPRLVQTPGTVKQCDQAGSRRNARFHLRPLPLHNRGMANQLKCSSCGEILADQNAKPGTEVEHRCRVTGRKRTFKVNAPAGRLQTKMPREK